MKHAASAGWNSACIALAALATTPVWVFPRAGDGPADTNRDPRPKSHDGELDLHGGWLGIVGSIGAHAIFRAAPGSATAEQWIAPGTDGLYQVLGVFADEAAETLWACSSNIDDDKPAPPSTLYAFDLSTGASKGHWPLPTAGAFCNDIAVGSDGTAYVTDTANMQIVRLQRGAESLEVWAGDGEFGAKGKVLDGIAVINGYVVVNVLETGKLFSVPIGADGRSGTVREVALGRELKNPDGQRSFGSHSLLVVEAGDGGRLSRVDLDSDVTIGKVTTLHEGFPDGPAAVTVVGETAYVIQAQWDSAKHENEPNYQPKPFAAIGVPVGTHDRRSPNRFPAGAHSAAADGVSRGDGRAVVDPFRAVHLRRR